MDTHRRLAVLTKVRKARLAAAERRLAYAITMAEQAWERFDRAEAAFMRAERAGLARIAREREHLFTVKFTVGGVSELRSTVRVVHAELERCRADLSNAEADAHARDDERTMLARDVQVRRAKVDRLDLELRQQRRRHEEHRDAAEVSEFAERGGV
jgi:hypothetical protein